MSGADVATSDTANKNEIESLTSAPYRAAPAASAASATTDRMRKIRCPHCNVINLEKFVTYPNCAGCGALLPEPVPERDSTYRRPLKPLLWATVLGLIGALVLVVTTLSTITTPVVEPAHLVIYGRVRHFVPVGRSVTVDLTLDTVEASASEEELSAVKMRLNDKFVKAFKIIAMTPPPDQTSRFGDGHYFEYESLPANAHLRFTALALHPGQYTMNLTVSAKDEVYGQYHTVITVRPAGHLPQATAVRAPVR